MPYPTTGVYIDRTNITDRSPANNDPSNAASASPDGPYQVGSNLYVVGSANNLTHRPIYVYKSTDSGNTWTAMNTGAAPFSVFTGFKTCQLVGTTLYIMYANSNSSNVVTGLRVITFDTLTDTFGSPTSDLGAGVGVSATQAKWTFQVMSGNYIAIFDSFPSTRALYHSKWNGATWSAPTQITDVAFATPPVLCGFARDTTNNRLHFLYQQYQLAGVSPLASNIIQHAYIDSTETVSAVDTAMTASQSFQLTPNFMSYPGFGEGIVLGSKLIFPFALQSSGLTAGLYFPATLTFNGSTWSNQTISTNVNDSNFAAQASIIAAFLVSTTIHIFWIGDTTDLSGNVVPIIEHVTTTDGVTFSSISTLMMWQSVLPPPITWDPTSNTINNISVSILADSTYAFLFESLPTDRNSYTFAFFSAGAINPLISSYDIGILTNIFDNNTPRQRKDSFTMRGRFKGTSCNFNIITDLTGEVLIATFSSVNWVDFTFDLNALLDVAFSGHPTWYQVHITGTTSEFFLADLEIFFDERPVPLTFKRFYNNNFGSTTPKRLRAWQFQMDTRGQNVTFTPYADNVALTPVTFSTPDKQTVQYSATTDVFGTDYGYTFAWTGTPGTGQGFELWEDDSPDFVETLPNGFLFWQCGPAHLFRYGRMLSFEIRLFAGAGLTTVPFTIYFDDNTRQSGTITVLPLKQNTYLVQGIKGEAGAVVRIEFGPTSVLFYPYYVRGKFQLSGADTDGQWVNIVENG